MIMNRHAYNNSGFIIDYNAASSLCSIRKTSDQQSSNSSDHFVRRQPMSDGGSVNSFDVKYKVLLLGDSLVGKTSLQRFVSGKDFRPNIGSTIGFDFVNKIIQVESTKVNLQIWDTAGQKNFRTMGKAHYAATKAFILVYDVTNEETFHLIEQFNQFIERAGLDMERRYLVANKIDLIEDRKVDEEQGQRFASRNSMFYFETSCKTGENILELFEQIASDLVRQHDPKLLKYHRPASDNFVYDYHASSPPENQIDNNNNNHEQIKKPKKKKKTVIPQPYERIDDNEGFNCRRLLFCCNPKKTTNTLD